MRILTVSGLVLAAATLTACSPMGKAQGNDVAVAAQRLIGQPASAAIELFGKPDQGLGPSSYGSGGFYAWHRLQTHIGPEKIFVKTGREQVGTRTTYAIMRGQGVAAKVPVGTQAVYRPVGYYTDDLVIDYLCNITLMTDAKDIVTQATVVDCVDNRK
ncbi:hypothetical protein IMZ29_02225 [Achromobacter sp. GG226]|uniref:hypothetical protein n=1 Tax=Verticiella alkaliphila TaxID=2779529 RepID=UPI001C0BB081|nr:hypothetical protein [Verticiella sp. GG226]MBU4609404.1 hypothetical protein [Verticiella sp. GG226]